MDDETLRGMGAQSICVKAVRKRVLHIPVSCFAWEWEPLSGSITLPHRGEAVSTLLNRVGCQPSYFSTRLDRTVAVAIHKNGTVLSCKTNLRISNRILMRAQTPAQRPQNRGKLWMILGIAGGILVLCCVVTGIAASCLQ